MNGIGTAHGVRELLPVMSDTAKETMGGGHVSEEDISFSPEAWKRAGSNSRLSLARNPFPPSAVEDEILSGADQRLLAVWASSPRRADLVDRAARVAGEGFVVKTLLLQESLSEEAARTMLHRCIEDERLSLVADLVDLTDPVTSREARKRAYSVLAKKYSDFRGRFAVWTQTSLESCLDVAASARGEGLAALESCARSKFRDEPAVRSAVIDGVVSAGGSDPVTVDWVVSALSLSPYLTSLEIDTLRRHASGAYTSLPAQLERRHLAQLSEVVSRVGCLDGGGPGARCVESLRALEGYAQDLTWVSGNVPLETAVHAQHLNASLVWEVIERTTSDLLHAALREFSERHRGGRPGLGHAASVLVENLGTPQLKSLPSGLAREAAYYLSRRGWSPLTWSESVDARVHDVVIDNFTPVGALLADDTYSHALHSRVALMQRGAQEAAQALLPEWVGSWSELSMSASVV